MNKPHQGFAVLESLLILVIVAIIGGTGYYVWHSKQQTDKTLNNASASSQSTTVSKKKASSSNTTKSADMNLIAAAIADKCLESDPHINKSNLEKILLDNFVGDDPSLTLNGNYARAGSTCDDTNSRQGGGFGSWLIKKNGTWSVAFEGQQPPVCDTVDGQGWPANVLGDCYDTSIKDYRAPK